MIFQERVLEFITGFREREISSLPDKIVRLFFGQTSEDKKTEITSEIIQKLTQWYIWTRLYRWVIATCIGILVATAGFAGSILLAKQKQNLRLSEGSSNLRNSGFIRSQLDVPLVSVTETTKLRQEELVLTLEYPIVK